MRVMVVLGVALLSLVVPSVQAEGEDEPVRDLAKQVLGTVPGPVVVTVPFVDETMAYLWQTASSPQQCLDTDVPPTRDTDIQFDGTTFDVVVGAERSELPGSAWAEGALKDSPMKVVAEWEFIGAGASYGGPSACGTVASFYTFTCERLEEFLEEADDPVPLLLFAPDRHPIGVGEPPKEAGPALRLVGNAQDAAEANKERVCGIQADDVVPPVSFDPDQVDVDLGVHLPDWLIRQTA